MTTPAANPTRGSQEAICGRCGYNVTGLPSFTCPECGSDLREVGIVTRARRRTPAIRRRGWTALLWTILCVAAAWAGSTLSDRYLWPYRIEGISRVELTPRSGEYRRLTLSEERSKRFFGSARPGAWTAWKLTLRLEKQGHERVMEVEPLKGMAWSFVDAQGQARSGTNLGVPEMWGWLMDCGVAPASPVTKEEASALVRILKHATGDLAEEYGTEGHGRLESIARRADQEGMLEEGWGEDPFVDQQTRVGELRMLRGFSPAWLWIPLVGVLWGLGLRRLRPWQGGKAAHRTLSILFTDIKDYTARTASASREELLELLAVNRQLVEPAVAARGGRIIKSIGDALLATFESATNAVLAGLEIQRRVRAHNATAAAGQQLELRVAVSTGEVVLTQGDVFGTAVNVASRVQNLAGPGEVYFTEATYHAMISAEVGFVEVGERELKGIDRPVKVFRAVEVR